MAEHFSLCLHGFSSSTHPAANCVISPMAATEKSYKLRRSAGLFRSSGLRGRDHSIFGSKRLLIDDEGRLFGDSVVELAGISIEILGHPVDFIRFLRVGFRIDSLDQRPANPLSAHIRIGKQVLQVADGILVPAGSVQQIMRKADRLTIENGQKSRIFMICTRQQP
jgi:hypothetical protein